VAAGECGVFRHSPSMAIDRRRMTHEYYNGFSREALSP
jgi:hypothetical protein